MHRAITPSFRFAALVRTSNQYEDGNVRAVRRSWVVVTRNV